MLTSSNDDGFNKFLSVCRVVLDKFASIKCKCIKRNSSPFINRTLSQGLIEIDTLKLEMREQEKLKQRITRVLLIIKKTKRSY